MFKSDRRLSQQEVNSMLFVASAPSRFGTENRSCVVRKSGDSILVVRMPAGEVVGSFSAADRDPRPGFSASEKAARLAILAQAIDDLREIVKAANVETLTQIATTRSSSSRMQDAFYDFASRFGADIQSAAASVWSRSNS